MHEQYKESLSALFDGEADELEMRRLLSGLDAESTARWQRYQLIGDAARNVLAVSRLDISVVDAVAAQLAVEPVVLAAPAAKKREHWLKPVLGFASAASIAFVAVLGVQSMNRSAMPVTAGFVANGNVSASQLPIAGGSGLNTVSGSVQAPALQREIEAIDAQKQRDAERLRYYMQQHTQHASYNNAQGLLPMARMVEEEQ